MTMMLICCYDAVVCVLLHRVVKDSERPFAYGIDWLAQRLLGELITVVIYSPVLPLFARRQHCNEWYVHFG